MTIEERNKFLVENDKLVHYVLKRYWYRRDYEDIAQSARLHVLKYLRTWDPSKSSVSGYIAFLAKRGALLYLSREDGTRKKLLSLNKPVSMEDPDSLEMVDLLSAKEPRVSTEEALDAERLFTLVFASRLDKKDHLILYLKYMSFTLQETGLLIGLSRERIRQRICNASRRLRYRPEIRRLIQSK